MNSSQFIRAALALACIGAIAAIASCTIDGRQLRDAGVRPEGSADASTLARPGEASARAKLLDFRLNPPPVTGLQLKRGADPGNSLLLATIAPDPRVKDTLTLNPDEGSLTLRDDGRDGDEVAGDRVFTARVPLNFDAEGTRQDQLINALREKRKPLVVREFRGREIVARRELPLQRLLDLRRAGILDLIDVGGAIVDEKKSLMVTDVSVVEDPSRTFNPCTNAGTANGKWTFGYLMTQMANEPLTGINPADFTQRMFRHWLNNQTVNSFTVPARLQMQTILNNWPKLVDGRLDISKAPVKLLAIVNRVDLSTNTSYGRGSGGEGRFVFAVLDTANGCTARPFTIILEYGVPKHNCSEIKSWAQQWLDLDANPINSAAYRTALEALTETFAHANADPAKPNGSAINQVRTDEIALAAPWELREFQIFSTDSDAGQLRMVTVKQTPDRATYNAGGLQQAKLATWINNNAAAIKLDKHTVPVDLPFPDLLPFLGGASPNGFDFWNAPGIADNDARFHFSVNTCDACHGRETNTSFTHVNPVGFGGEASLSGFLKGDGAGGDFDVTDPVVPATHHLFNDLARRAQVLHNIATRSCFLQLGRRPLLMSH